MNVKVSEGEEIPMYCCLPFSYAVKYGIITIDEYIGVEISLKSTLPEVERQGIIDRLHNEHISSWAHPDYLHIIHCPWCGCHVSTVIDFDKGMHAGQYTSKEGWEK